MDNNKENPPKFGRLTFVSEDPTKKSYWICICDCTNTKSIYKHSLLSGATKSCGCLSSELAKERTKTLNKTHGLSNTAAYRSWLAAIKRCNDANDIAYHRYGGRGIKVCDRWMESIENFVEDMGHPQKGETLERIDNNGNYCPENCKWLIQRLQSRNRRNTIRVEFRGETRVLCDLADEFHLPTNIVCHRYLAGWNIEDILSTPHIPKKLKPRLKVISVYNEEKTLKEWSKDERCVVSLSILKQRIGNGWTPVDAISKAIEKPKSYQAFGEAKTLAEWVEDDRCQVSKIVLKSRVYEKQWDIERALTTPNQKHKQS